MRNIIKHKSHELSDCDSEIDESGPYELSYPRAKSDKREAPEDNETRHSLDVSSASQDAIPSKDNAEDLTPQTSQLADKPVGI